MTQEQLREIFSYHNWRQRIPLKNQQETPGTNFSHEWEKSFLPDNLQGRTFLDVGSNDGMFSFLAESKGASRVVATDVYTTERNSHMTFGWNKTGIDRAHQALESKIEVKDYSIYELDQINGTFDFVFCSNVLAWLKDPLTAMEQLAAKCNSVLHLREDISLVNSDKPELTLVHDFNKPSSTCYYNPNKKWFETVLKGLGFNQIEFRLIDEKEILKYRQLNFPKYFITKGTPVWQTPFESSPSGQLEQDIERRATMEYQNFIFIPTIGWLNKEKCSFRSSTFQEGNKLKSQIKKLMGSNEDWKQINHAIIAYR